MIKGQHGQPKKKKRKQKAVGDQQTEAKGAAALESLRQAIAEGHTVAALAIYQKAEQTPGLWQTPETDLLGLIKLLHAEQRFVESVPVMEQYIHRFPQKTARVRLKLAQILIRDLQRPAHALRVLTEIPAAGLPAELEQLRQQLERKANQMRAEGVLELEGL
ncbi:MAG TPA: hypothetical protein VGZ22_16120 [Isosphaeraceae bacterium]|nr:hypothetical protein [Isosphaeraceae bacterium]